MLPEHIASIQYSFHCYSPLEHMKLILVVLILFSKNFLTVVKYNKYKITILTISKWIVLSIFHTVIKLTSITFSCHKTKTLYPWNKLFLILPSPQLLVNYHFTSCLYNTEDSRYFIQVIFYSICLFVIGLFQLA